MGEIGRSRFRRIAGFWRLQQNKPIWFGDLMESSRSRVHQFDDIDGRGRTSYLARFSPLLPLLATTYISDEAVSLFRSSDQVLRGIAHRRSDDTAQFTSLSYSPDANALVAGDDSGKILLWQLPAERLVDPQQNQATTPLSLLPVTVSSPHLARVTSIAVTAVNCDQLR